jgi:integrase
MAHASTIYLQDEETDFYEALYAVVSHLDGECDPFPIEIETFFGQNLKVREDSGRLKSVLRVVNVGKDSSTYKLSDTYSNYDYINYIAVRLWLDTVIERTPSMLNHLSIGLHSLHQISLTKQAFENEATFSSEIASQLSSIMLENKNDQRVWMSVRGFVDYAIENDYWGFNETIIFKLAEIKIPMHSKKFRVSLLDHENGPFTRTEIQDITQAIRSDKVAINDSVMLKLAMHLGLRPIQLALLRETDIYYDESKLGWYINIPRVKGKSSQLRRSQNNFVLRELTDDLANDIAALIELDADRVLSFNGTKMPRPLFKRNAVDELMLLHEKLKEYAWHRNSKWISMRFRLLEQQLSILSRYLKDDYGQPRLLKIGCYRFRYTLGTRMVLEGKTPEELAIALDHGSTNSVQHYFRYNRDLIDFIDDTFDSSIVLENAVMRWKGFLIDENDSSVGGRLIRTSSIANLGKCLKQTSCEFHPTVSCYGCGKFRPFKNADHQAQLKVIEAEREFVQQHSSGPVRHQLDEALQGAIEICEAQNLLKKESDS